MDVTTDHLLVMIAFASLVVAIIQVTNNTKK
ncbi:putative holin-like toxin [Viridibacillus arvi]